MKDRPTVGTRGRRSAVVLGITLAFCLGVLGIAGPRLPFGSADAAARDGGPDAADFVDITKVAPATPAPRPGPDASTGLYQEDCGRNANHHRNADNMVISPGIAGAAHHTHDYVGNLSTDASSSDRTLAAAGTTCTDGDRSTFYWPVLRRLDRPGTDTGAAGGGAHGNVGQILDPVSVRVEFRGNPASQVVAMPRFLRLETGDPVAATQGLLNAHAEWGCAAYPDRVTTKYPLCPPGSDLTRTLDFPSCWDGLRNDSPDHRDHAVFPLAGGVCPRHTFPVPQLRVVLDYAVPRGVPFALDAFPEQRHNPITEHAFFVNVMAEQQMARVVACVNGSRRC